MRDAATRPSSVRRTIAKLRHLPHYQRVLDNRPLLYLLTADAVITYAWNEHDEGGWLCPTLGADGEPDTRRVEAMGKVLRRR